VLPAPYIPEDQIEKLIEDELERSGLKPPILNPVLNLAQFIERHLMTTLDEYAELPQEVMGEVCFEFNKKPHISINRDLTENADNGDSLGVLGRLRATIAHEAGHVILHKSLFSFDEKDQVSLFSGDLEKDVRCFHRCLKRDLHRTSGSIERVEIQANIAMAALLMPKSLFIPLAKPLLKNAQRHGASHPNCKQADDMVHKLAQEFRVSHQAARIRLQKLQLLPGPHSLEMWK